MLLDLPVAASEGAGILDRDWPRFADMGLVSLKLTPVLASEKDGSVLDAIVDGVGGSVKLPLPPRPEAGTAYGMECAPREELELEKNPPSLSVRPSVVPVRKLCLSVDVDLLTPIWVMSRSCAPAGRWAVYCVGTRTRVVFTAGAPMGASDAVGAESAWPGGGEYAGASARGDQPGGDCPRRNPDSREGEITLRAL
jgi:hypothetical protein